jgi:hypothetical protein
MAAPDGRSLDGRPSEAPPPAKNPTLQTSRQELTVIKTEQ